MKNALVEPLSLDEAYLDVTDNAWRRTARHNRRATAEGSDPRAHRLDGLSRRRPEQVSGEDRLRLAKAGRADGHRAGAGGNVPAVVTNRCPVGVGPVTAKKLRARGIKKLVDIRTVDPRLLRETVGSLADWLKRLAQGIDDRPVVSERHPKSSGSERTFADDVTNLDSIRDTIRTMASNAAAWLLSHELYARTLTVKSAVPRLHDDHQKSQRRPDTRCRCHCGARAGTA